MKSDGIPAEVVGNDEHYMADISYSLWWTHDGYKYYSHETIQVHLSST